jgi:hypothetical protein
LSKSNFNTIRELSKEISGHNWFNRDEIIFSMAFPEQKETFEKVLKEFENLRRENIF